MNERSEGKSSMFNVNVNNCKHGSCADCTNLVLRLQQYFCGINAQMEEQFAFRNI